MKAPCLPGVTRHRGIGASLARPLERVVSSVRLQCLNQNKRKRRFAKRHQERKIRKEVTHSRIHSLTHSLTHSLATGTRSSQLRCGRIVLKALWALGGQQQGRSEVLRTKNSRGGLLALPAMAKARISPDGLKRCWRFEVLMFVPSSAGFWKFHHQFHVPLRGALPI